MNAIDELREKTRDRTYEVTVGFGCKIKFEIDAFDQSLAAVRAIKEFEYCDLNDICELVYVNVEAIEEKED